MGILQGGRVFGRLAMTAAAPAGYLEIAALARACRAPALTDRDRHCARSLLECWSRTEGKLTSGQWHMAAVLVHKAGGAPEPGRRKYVLTKAPETRWWLDTSPHRQSCRGCKSGVARRYATRERDARIARWVNRGRYTVRQVAKHVGLAASTVSRIASRARGGAGFWRGPERAHPLPPSRPRRPLREPSMNTLGAFSPAPFGSRNPSIFTSLTSWTGLRAIQRLPDSAIMAEAERLNRELARPLRPTELRRIVRSVNQRRKRFAQPLMI